MQPFASMPPRVLLLAVDDSDVSVLEALACSGGSSRLQPASPYQRQGGDQRPLAARRGCAPPAAAAAGSGGWGAPPPAGTAPAASVATRPCAATLPRLQVSETVLEWGIENVYKQGDEASAGSAADCRCRRRPCLVPTSCGTCCLQRTCAAGLRCVPGLQLAGAQLGMLHSCTTFLLACCCRSTCCTSSPCPCPRQAWPALPQHALLQPPPVQCMRGAPSPMLAPAVARSCGRPLVRRCVRQAVAVGRRLAAGVLSGLMTLGCSLCSRPSAGDWRHWSHGQHRHSGPRPADRPEAREVEAVGAGCPQVAFSGTVVGRW